MLLKIDASLAIFTLAYVAKVLFLHCPLGATILHLSGGENIPFRPPTPYVSQHTHEHSSQEPHSLKGQTKRLLVKKAKLAKAVATFMLAKKVRFG